MIRVFFLRSILHLIPKMLTQISYNIITTQINGIEIFIKAQLRALEIMAF